MINRLCRLEDHDELAIGEFALVRRALLAAGQVGVRNHPAQGYGVGILGDGDVHELQLAVVLIKTSVGKPQLDADGAEPALVGVAVAQILGGRHGHREGDMHRVLAF